MTIDLSLFVALLALLAGTPFFARGVVHYGVSPSLEIELHGERNDAGEYLWYGLNKETLLEHSNSDDLIQPQVMFKRGETAKHDLIVERIEFSLDKPWPVREQNKVELHGTYRYILNLSAVQFGSGESELAADFNQGILFPFETQQENQEITITVYPKIRMSEFGLPRFFGEVSLKPVQSKYVITGE